ncbi:unnamed protein product [Amoebophrya sp. A25]|nr:unnamed protein product [Amoebophrya sp. A25]|eukprot:GSA25T00000878001.1
MNNSPWSTPSQGQSNASRSTCSSSSTGALLSEDSYLDHRVFPELERGLMDLVEKAEFDSLMQYLIPLKSLVDRPHESLTEDQVKFKARALAELRSLSKHRQSLAHFAAVRKADPKVGGAYKVLKILADLGVDVCMVDAFSQTPLFYAAREGNVEACAYLIETHKLDPNQKDLNGQNPLYYAAKLDASQFGTKIEVLQKQHQEKTGKSISKQLAWFPTLKSTGKLKTETKRSTDFNERTHKQNRMSTVKLLVDAGADPNMIDVNNRQPLDYAIDTDVVRYMKGQMAAAPDPIINRRHFRVPADIRALMEEQDRKSPILFMSEPASHYEGQYMVHYSALGDADTLAALETEFIHDHERMIHNAEDETPPWPTVCASVGLNQDLNQRQTIIRNIAGRKDKNACTLKVSYFDVSPKRPPDEPTHIEGLSASKPSFYGSPGGYHLCGRNRVKQQNLDSVLYPCIKWMRFETVGYLYQKSKLGKVTAAKSSSVLEKQEKTVYFDDKENCPTVEISHLKVSKDHKRRQVAVMLCCGLVQHLVNNALVPCIADMRLSVFAMNLFAVRLYEKLQFEQDGDEWASDLVSWPRKVSSSADEGSSAAQLALKKSKDKDKEMEEDDTRVVTWRRYRRLDPGTDPQELLQRFTSLIRYADELSSPKPASKRRAGSEDLEEKKNSKRRRPASKK